jgi:nicotinate-nucleotide pyrophosphorylase
VPTPLPPPQAVVEADVERALAEDLGSGDVTASLLADEPQRGYVIAKEAGVIAGRHELKSDKHDLKTDKHDLKRDRRDIAGDERDKRQYRRELRRDVRQKKAGG